jgi:hypothetical protein
LSEKELGATQKTEDLLNYRPNPDMLVPRSDMTLGVSQDIEVSSSAIVFVFFRLSFTKLRNKFEVLFMFVCYRKKEVYIDPPNLPLLLWRKVKSQSRKEMR